MQHATTKKNTSPLCIPRRLPVKVMDRIREAHDILEDEEVTPDEKARASATLASLRKRHRLTVHPDQPDHLDIRLCWDGCDVDDLRTALLNPRNGSALPMAALLRDVGDLRVPDDLARVWRRNGATEIVYAIDARGIALVHIEETVILAEHTRLRVRLRSMPISLLRERREMTTSAQSDRAMKDALSWLKGRATYALWSSRVAEAMETVTGRVLAATRRHIIQEDASTRTLVVRHRALLGWGGYQEAADAMLASSQEFSLGPTAELAAGRLTAEEILRMVPAVAA